LQFGIEAADAPFGRETTMKRFQRLMPIRLFVLLAMISVVPPVLAREKTDVVILKNGDHLLCEIRSLARGMLTVKTDSMSTVQIKWQDVEKLTSSSIFTIQDTQGRIYVGRLQAAADGRRVDVAGARPASNLDHLAIVSIQKLEVSQWKRFSGAANLGYSYTKASARTQFNFSGDLLYRTERYSSQFGYSSTIGTSNGEKDADRNVLTLNGSRSFLRKWLAYSQIKYENNVQLQLERRFSFLGGPGYRIRQSNKSLVTVIGAASVTQESYLGQESTKNAEGYFGIDAEFFKLYSPKINIVNQFVFLPNFTTWGRLRTEFSTNLNIEVLKDFFISFTFYDSYDNRPPSQTATKNDYGFTTGIGWSFRR
jgi:hypothetical protein